MQESRFWQIYFTLASKHLPVESMDGQRSEAGGAALPAAQAPHGNGAGVPQPSSDPEQHPASDAKDGKGKEGGTGGGHGELSSDAELDAYLENVLKEEGVEGRSADGDFEDLEDFDEYLDQLNSEVDGDTDAVEVLSADVESYQSGQTPPKAAA